MPRQTKIQKKKRLKNSIYKQKQKQKHQMIWNGLCLVYLGYGCFVWCILKNWSIIIDIWHAHYNWNASLTSTRSYCAWDLIIMVREKITSIEWRLNHLFKKVTISANKEHETVREMHLLHKRLHTYIQKVQRKHAACVVHLMRHVAIYIYLKYNMTKIFSITVKWMQQMQWFPIKWELWFTFGENQFEHNFLKTQTFQWIIALPCHSIDSIFAILIWPQRIWIW